MLLEQMQNLSNEDQATLFKKIKHIRQSSKTVVYAAQYGVSPEGLNRNVGMDVEQGKKLLDTYWNINWSAKKASENFQVQTVSGKHWLYNPVSKLWYSLRTDKDRLSVACQGLGAYCFDIWLKYVLERRRQVNGQFHDEHITTIKKGYREEHSKLLLEALKDANNELKLNRELEISIEYGDSYASIH